MVLLYVRTKFCTTYALATALILFMRARIPCCRRIKRPARRRDTAHSAR